MNVDELKADVDAARKAGVPDLVIGEVVKHYRALPPGEVLAMAKDVAPLAQTPNFDLAGAVALNVSRRYPAPKDPERPTAAARPELPAWMPTQQQLRAHGEWLRDSMRGFGLRPVRDGQNAPPRISAPPTASPTPYSKPAFGFTRKG